MQSKKLAYQLRPWALAVTTGLLVGCANLAPQSTSSDSPAPPRRTSWPFERDGPPASPPPGLEFVPDAEPRIENIRKGGPNKPYEALGRVYTPMTSDQPYTEKGLASWYGRKFHGRPTSSGEIYDMYAMTAAHPTLPIPSYAKVRNPANGREIIVRVNDRGPFHRGRVIDLSYTAALKLDVLDGVRKVEVERITYEDIRTGAWRREGPPRTMLARVPEGASPQIPGGPQAEAVVALPPQIAESAPPPSEPPPPSAQDQPSMRPAEAGPAAQQQLPTPSGAAAQSLSSPAPSEAAPVEPMTTDAATVRAPMITSVLTPASPGVGTPMKAAPPDLGAENPLPRATPLTSGGFWLQLGVFRQRDGAADFRRRVAGELDWLAPLLAIFQDRSVHRLQAGPYTTHSEAKSAAERIRNSLRLVPVIVERR